MDVSLKFAPASSWFVSGIKSDERVLEDLPAAIFDDDKVELMLWY